MAGMESPILMTHGFSLISVNAFSGLLFGLVSPCPFSRCAVGPVSVLEAKFGYARSVGHGYGQLFSTSTTPFSLLGLISMDSRKKQVENDGGRFWVGRTE